MPAEKNNSKCSVEGCLRTGADDRIILGFCNKHYRQYKKHGYVVECSKTEPNTFIEHDDYFEIVLRNENCEEVAKTKIDKEDFERVIKYKWCLSGGYAHNGSVGRMHRLIMKAKKDEQIDHKSTKRLDNRKRNLRISSQTENMQNIGVSRSNKSGHKGVCWENFSNKWLVTINVNGKKVNLGRYSNKEKAAKVYRKAAKRYHGTFFNANTRKKGN